MKVICIRVPDSFKKRSPGFSIIADQRCFSRKVNTVVQFFGGNKEAAYQWMYSPVKALGSISPLSLFKNENGIMDIEDLIGRLEHGVFT